MSTSESGASAGGLTRRAPVILQTGAQKPCPEIQNPPQPSLPQISMELEHENRGVLNLARVSSGIHRTISKAENPLQGC